MADFCWDCTERVLGVDGRHNDLAELCAPGYVVAALCEGCGEVFVDHTGVVVWTADEKQAADKTEVQA